MSEFFQLRPQRPARCGLPSMSAAGRVTEQLRYGGKEWGGAPALWEAYALSVSFEPASTLLEVSTKTVSLRVGKMSIRKILRKKKTEWESHITSLPINEINYGGAKIEATWE